MPQWGPFSLRDAADILLVAFVVYQILIIFRGSRAIQILLGLILVFSVYLVSEYLGLVTLSWMLDHFFTYLVLIMVILFQDEIRTALTHVGKFPLFGRQIVLRSDVVEEMLRALYAMAERGVGALIVVERMDNLGKYIASGHDVDAVLSRELLLALFQKDSPLHDGAVVVRGNRIEAAGCFLPVAMDEQLPRDLGTRHRAALGLSRESDAAILVVSEERKSVSLVFEGSMRENLPVDAMRVQLQRVLGELRWRASADAAAKRAVP